MFQMIHSKTNVDGYKPEGITYPSRVMQQKLLVDFYDEIKENPEDLTFVEAHGTGACVNIFLIPPIKTFKFIAGTVVGDPEELNTIDTVFTTNRKRPLLIGAVKSNIGHSEPASGLCSVVKVIFNRKCVYRII